MADDCHPSVMDPFEVYTSERYGALHNLLHRSSTILANTI